MAAAKLMQSNATKSNARSASKLDTTKSNGPRIVDPVRYKTVMCVNWAKDGSCPYDFKCQFAHGEHELRERKDKLRKQQKAKKASSDDDSTPVCSPCSSVAPSPVSSPASSPVSWRRESKPAATRKKSVVFKMTTPPRTRATTSPPALIPTPPGLPLPPGLNLNKGEQLPAFFGADAQPSLDMALESDDAPARIVQPAAAAPIDLAGQGGAAGRFAAAPDSSFVPEGVRALWEGSGDAAGVAFSPLRCNRTTGKVEEVKVPWLVRRMSSASMLVRRAVSFVLEEEALKRQRSKRASRSDKDSSEKDSSASSQSLARETSHSSARRAAPRLLERSWSKLRIARPAVASSSA